MPLTKYKTIGTDVFPDPDSESGWTALAVVSIRWDCVPPQDTDGDVDVHAEVRAWIESWLNKRLP